MANKRGPSIFGLLGADHVQHSVTTVRLVNGGLLVDVLIVFSTLRSTHREYSSYVRQAESSW